MFELWKLKRRRDKLRRTYDKQIAALRKQKKARTDEMVRLESEESYEMGEAYKDLSIYMGDQLLAEAFEYDVRVPATNDPEFWVVSTEFTRGYLTSSGRHHVRRLIGEEKTRRFEVKTLWVTRFILPLAGLLIGIIGALTGLAAVLRHKP